MCVSVCVICTEFKYFKAISFTSIPLEYYFYNLRVSEYFFSADKIELRKIL